MKDANKLMGEVNVAMDGPILRKASEEKDQNDTIPSGVAELDVMLGGGWPTGCLNVIYGPQSSGKSMISLVTIASAQKLCRHCFTPFSSAKKCECGKKAPCKVLYIDAERSWTNRWSRSLGIDPEQVIVGHPRHMQEAFAIVDSFIREEAVDLIILDSIAALCPKEEVDGTMEEWQTGLVPRVYSKFLRKWATELQNLECKGGRFPATIFVNQIRMKVGVMFGSPEVMPGGEAQKYFGSTIIRVSKKAIEMSKDKADPMYQTIHFVVEKSKVGPVRRTGDFDIPINNYIDKAGVTRLIGQVDNVAALMKFAKKFEVVKGQTGKYTFGGKEYKTWEELESALRTDISLCWTLFKAINKAYEEYLPRALDVPSKKTSAIHEEES